MCCSVRDSLVGTLAAVLQECPGRFDYAIVEASGVADPENVRFAAAKLCYHHNQLGDTHVLD